MTPIPDWAKEAHYLRQQVYYSVSHFNGNSNDILNELEEDFKQTLIRVYSKGIEDVAKFVEKRRGISEHHIDLAEQIRALGRVLEER